MVKKIALIKALGTVISVFGLFLVGAWCGAWCFDMITFKESGGELLFYIVAILMGLFLKCFYMNKLEEKDK